MQHHTMQHLNSSNSSMTTPVLPENVVGSIILGLCVVLGVPGNIAVMVRLVGWLKGDSFTPRLMLSLAVSDLLCLILLPVRIQAFLSDWMFGSITCKAIAYVVYFSICCSTLCVILLSVQRYMQVLHPQKWAKLREEGQKSLLIGMWILSGILASYALIQRTVEVDETGQVACSLRYRTVTEKVATLLWEAFIPLVSLVLLTFMYLRLYRRVNQSVFYKKHHLATVVTRIVVTFFIVWIPFVITKFVSIFAQLLWNCRLENVAGTVGRITSALPFINSCVNPFLYGFTALTLQRQAAGAQNP